jgi:hypothetical protein
MLQYFLKELNKFKEYLAPFAAVTHSYITGLATKSQ